MRLIKMSYKGVELEVNPSTLEVSHSKSISTRVIPFSGARTREMSLQPSVISGSGRFTGEGSREQAFMLERAFRSKGSAYLFVPGASPMRAFFKSLSLSYDSRENAVSYSFEFVEDGRGKSSEHNYGYAIAKKDESLYDIANRTGVDVKTLFEANSYKDLFSVRNGDKVWLS